MLVKHGDDVAEFVSDYELPQPVWNHGVEGVWAVDPVKVPRAGDIALLLPERSEILLRPPPSYP